jgi:site-specific recombinase XerD
MAWWCERLVGYGRLTGEHAYEQLAEVYRALRLYVNCFQPSMKLVSKQVEGRKIHRTYDVARTPLQRLLLSGTLSPSRLQELYALAQALDPLRLFQQVERLQQALFRCEVCGSTPGQPPQAPTLVSFELEGVTTERFSCKARGADEGGMSPGAQQEPAESVHILDWRHTSKDPFVGQWEQICALVQANPSRSGGDIFRELQSQFPGRYQPGHLRTLQRGIRKIRTCLLATREEPRQPDMIHADKPIQTPPSSAEALHHVSCCTSTRPGDPSAGEKSTDLSSAALLTVAERAPALSGKTMRAVTPAPIPWERKTATPAFQASSRRRSYPLTIERAIRNYLHAQRAAKHRPKTLEWHRNALNHFQHYLLEERHRRHVSQITEVDIHAWIASLGQMPTAAGRQRSASTIETYARSVRAFCTWLVQQGVLICSPMSEEVFPRACVPLPQVVLPEMFEQYIQASCSSAPNAKRDRALLWVLFDTGITLSEVCALRLTDVDQTTGMLSVKGRGGKIRRMTLGFTCLGHLRAYLSQADPARKHALTRRQTGDDPLFFSERGQALTKSSLTSLLNRVRTRVGVSETVITPQNLRHSFALRYLQAGGEPQGLQALMGYEGMAPVTQYLRWHDQLLHRQTQQRTEEV